MSRSPRPLSSASRVSRLSQVTPSHIEEALVALELVALALTTVVFTAVAFTAVQPWAAGWR